MPLCSDRAGQARLPIACGTDVHLARELDDSQLVV